MSMATVVDMARSRGNLMPSEQATHCLADLKTNSCKSNSI
jgi:hypothetical protein